MGVEASELSQPGRRGSLWRNSHDSKKSSNFNSFNGQTQDQRWRTCSIEDKHERFSEGTLDTEASPRQVSDGAALNTSFATTSHLGLSNGNVPSFIIAAWSRKRRVSHVVVTELSWLYRCETGFYSKQNQRFPWGEAEGRNSSQQARYIRQSKRVQRGKRSSNPSTMCTSTSSSDSPVSGPQGKFLHQCRVQWGVSGLVRNRMNISGALPSLQRNYLIRAGLPGNV